MSSLVASDVAIADLDRQIIDAHANGDGPRLAALYAEAARCFIAAQEFERAAFLLVNAYVWALEAGEESVAAYAHKVLVGMGREQ
jgi:hypothetical protein